MMIGSMSPKTTGILKIRRPFL